MTTASELVDLVPGRMPRPVATRDGALGGDPASSMMNSGTLTRVPEVLAADALSGACPSAARATPPPIRTTAGAAAQMRRHGIMTVRVCSCLLTTRLLAGSAPHPRGLRQDQRGGSGEVTVAATRLRSVTSPATRHTLQTPWDAAQRGPTCHHETRPVCTFCPGSGRAWRCWRSR